MFSSPPTIDIDEVLPKLSTLEKISLLSGSDNWHTFPIPKHGIPAARMSDGPNGIRGMYMFNGTPSSCFPCSTGMASSFDIYLIQEIGYALAEECKQKGSHVILAPTVNIHRSPVFGRGFESFSEDPHLNGTIAAAYINAMQERKVICTIKHFVAADQETDRKTYSAEISPRALREIYLKPFQLAIKHSNPGALMMAYNRVAGVHASESDWLIEDILRKEWGFEGMVMSDWSGTYSCTKAIKAGLDLEMPGPPTVRGMPAFRAITSGKLSVSDLDIRARKVLELVIKAQKSGIPFDVEEKGVDTPELRELLRRSASDSIVLLKNSASLLPLTRQSSIRSIAVIGYNANIAVTSGGGAADLLPSYTVTPLQGIRSVAQEVLGLSPGSIKYAVGAPAFRFIPLLHRYLFTGDQQGGLVEFWNGPFNAKGLQDVPPVFTTKTLCSEMRLNDHIADIVSDTCWYRYSGDFIPDQDGDWEFSIIVAGQGNLYIDGKLIIDNTTKQTCGTYFLAQGSVEEKGTVKNMKAGQKYAFEVRATNEINLNNTSPYKTRGALRVGAWKPVDEEVALQEAVTLATEADVAIVVVGLTQEFEAEAFDRPNMDLPGNSNHLITSILSSNPRTIIITQSGTPVSLPWLSSAPTLVHAFYGGNDLGGGLADVLFGKRGPSGKLPVSWPRRLEECPSFTSFGGEHGIVRYSEDIYVGYRHPHYPVSFPFGHGLTYTTFSYLSLSLPHKITHSLPKSSANLSVSVTIKNTGSSFGGEIIQLYIADPSCSLPRPAKELKGFTKVWLKPGEKKTVTIELDREAWCYWDDLKGWVAEKGEFEILVGASSEDIRLRDKVVLEETITWKGL